MSAAPSTPHVHSHSKTEFCHQKSEKCHFLINLTEKISAIALGIFSAYTNLKLFVPFFLAGVAIGIYSYNQDKDPCKKTHPTSSCAHGLIEQLTGVKLPRVVSLIANIAVTVCHIDHHATVFVPVVGVSLGAWIGKLGAQLGDNLQQRCTANRSGLNTTALCAC
jgi:hypothetical protein